jgi:hypothetical protein
MVVALRALRGCCRPRGIALVLVALVTFVPSSAGTAAATPRTEDSIVCGDVIPPEEAPSREINLVLDDSGSMFADGPRPADRLERWSYAKYSLEVFAALLAEGDTLNVYLMSDFDDEGTPNPRPALTLRGTETPAERVQQIRDMQLRGGNTPYAPVEAAHADIVASAADERWLVVLSDGQFDGTGRADQKNPAEVQQDISSWVDAARGEGSALKVAFLAIGDDAPAIRNEPDLGIFFERAASSDELTGLMTGFANQIFQRDPIGVSSGNVITTDVPLDEAVVFAQGRDVTVGPARTSDGEVIEAEDQAEVRWTENDRVETQGAQVTPLPNKSLRGTLAVFNDLPTGEITFDVDGASDVAVFFKPRLNFGIRVTDVESGAQIPTGESVPVGTYRIEYGLYNEECEFFTPALLGDVTGSGTITADGETRKFSSGEEITLGPGPVAIETSVSFGGKTSPPATREFTVDRAALSAGITAEQRTYQVSQLNDLTEGDAIRLRYALTDGGALVDFTPEQWATLQAENVTVTSPTNIVFVPSIGDEIGEILLLPTAPDGDIYAAATGEVPYSVSIQHDMADASATTEETFDTQIEDDLSALDRLRNWLATVGWKLLLLLLALLLLLGYVFKPRFSRRIKARPTITGSPRGLGRPPEPGRGAFRKNTARKFLPFVADKATLTYVPAAARGSFRPMRLKAQRGGGIALLNAREIGKRGNVSINGTDLTEDMSRAPQLSAGSIISATTADTTYEMTLSS